MKVVQFKNVWEMYRIPFLLGKQTLWENFWALKDIEFDINKGQTVGIIGKNGSGKSTILKLIAGILSSDRGQVVVEGRVSGLLELGAGFQPELTGMENVYLNIGLFGLTPSQIDEKYDSIVNFAGIGKFMNAPVKCYSSGMFMRLAFAIAIQVDPDILLVDDTLAVGDEDSQRKCIKKIFELKECGKTIVFVTHDMCLASMLCNRLIFLDEGRIVSEGSAKEIIGHYIETVGDKKGIGVIQSGPLRVTFNNGKIVLTWKNVPVTKGLGAHSSVFVLDKSYDSTQADWTAEVKEDCLEIVAVGKWWRLPVSQRWRVKIGLDSSVSWDIEMVLEEGMNIEKTQANVMLTENYREWFTPKAKGCFHNILPEDRNWEELFRCDLIKTCLGVKDMESGEEVATPVLFESLDCNSTNIAAVLNSDHSNNARILQFSKFEHHFLPKGKSACFSGRISFDMAILGQYKGKKDVFVLEKDNLKLIFDGNNANIFWGDLMLTKGLGIYSSFLCHKIWHSCVQADWAAETDKNFLCIKARWNRIPVIQIWNFSFAEDGSIRWSMDIEVLRELDIEVQQVNIMLSDKYKNWITSVSCGEFPEVFSESWTDVIQGNIKDGFVGVENFYEDKDSFPRIMVVTEHKKENPNNFAKIFNSDLQSMGRTLQLCRYADEGRSRFLPGRYHCFSARIYVVQQQKKIGSYANNNMIDRYPLRLFFQKGSGRIFWRGTEFTKNLCLYTSIRSEHIWNDSTQARWEHTEASDNKLVLKGTWRCIPIVQTWQLSLIDDNLIDWQVNMEVLEQIAVDRQQTNIMLSENYLNWMAADGSKGRFALFRSDIDDDWDRLWSGAAKGYIGVESFKKDKKLFPGIYFTGSSEGLIMNIVNSDVYYRGRVLQALNENKIVLMPGKYDYFSGKVEIKET
jgi:ABC-type polysaccharide/polyol phosphate transport system ATPase subunit